MSKFDTTSQMAKVRALLDTAESLRETNPEAAASYQAKAETLMRKWRLDEENLIASDQFSLTPVLVNLTVCGQRSPYRQQYVNMMWYCADHTGTRVTFDWERAEDGGHHVVAKVVGYESDIRYAEMLFTAARLVFAERLEPQVNPALSEQVNVYRLRGAGIERVRVAEMVWGEATKANLSKVGAMYKRECAARGEEAALSGRGVTGKVYRESYSEEFTYKLGERLRAARDGADSVGGAMVLKGRKERVDEVFYTNFPYLRPSTEVAVVEQPKECDDCKRTKHESGQCKAHRPYVPTKADQAREAARMARYYSPAAQRGREAGTTAAREVALDRSAQAQRLDEDTTRTTVRDLTGLELEA